MSPYIKRTERSQINELILQHKFQEKQEQENPKQAEERNNKNKG
jgi:hypothetical protein